jgi:hypothetical protein
MITGEGEYRMSALRLESVYPVILGYKNSVAGGYRINLSDYLGLNRLNFTTAYSPDRSLPSGERLHAMFEFRRYDWKASAAYNGADFYDLFGPTKTGFKGYALELGYNRALIYDQPKKLLLSLEGAYFGNLERLPDYQNVQVGFSRFLRTRAKLEYSNLRSSLGHVDDEKGTRWEVVAQDNLVNGTSIPMIHADHDFGAALPLRHSSLWVRSSAGAAFGNREDPFASFYFGGFGNNWVDHGPEKRYREFYSFPGKAINDVGGRNYAKTMVEWNLPPLRFRRAGTPGFYASWARTSLFCGGIATNLDDADFRRKVWDLGTQVDVRFSLLSRLDMTLSLGYGAAFEKGRRRDEFMLSVKILN